MAQESHEILGIGSYQGGQEGPRRVTYVRLRSGDANRVARMLTEKNYKVLQSIRKPGEAERIRGSLDSPEARCSYEMPEVQTV